MDLDDRAIAALELIGGALQSIAKTLERDHQRKYPPRKEPTEPTITHIKTDEELLRESLGETGEETTEEWLTIGPRERAYLEREKDKP